MQIIASMVSDLPFFCCCSAHLAIAMLAVAVMATVHIAACIFYLMASLEKDGTSTWITAAGIQALSLPQKYLTSLYWAITTITTGKLCIISSMACALLTYMQSMHAGLMQPLSTLPLVPSMLG